MTESVEPAGKYCHACSACGKCCNSAPALSFAELLHHRHRFIGALAVSRHRRHNAGDMLRIGQRNYCLTADDAAEFDALASRIWFRESSDSWIQLCVISLEYPSRGRCPALQDDGLCGIHGDRKPTICSAVPLDPAVPDSLQHLVMADRVQTADFVGANCIGQMDDNGAPAAAQQLGLPLMINVRKIVDASAAKALADRRAELMQDKQSWGNAVFSAMRPALRDTYIAPGGFVTLPLVPILGELARRPDELGRRSQEVANAQRSLIAREIANAISRKNLLDRPMTEQLRRFNSAYAAAYAD